MKDLTTEDIKAVATSSKDVVTKRIWLVVAISLIVVIADQIFKIWVKTNFLSWGIFEHHELVGAEIHRE